MPKISIIIPCYNQAQYLSEAVHSALNQSCQDFEIIIVNDGSTDDTKIVAEQLLVKDDRIQLINQENQGLSASRNNGIAIAKGEYILPLDADDKIGQNYLELGINVLDKKHQINIVYGNAELFGAENKSWDLPSFSLENILKKNLIYCSAIFRRYIYHKTSGYNPNMRYGWEDWDLWLSMIENGAQFFKLEETVFYYRVKQQSMVKGIAKEKIKRQYLEQQLISNHIELYKKYFPDPLTLLRELDGLRQEKQSFEQYKYEILGSFSYRIGHFILSPLKFLRKLLH
ncbi:glycosyltransferase family 2 protein [Winogradskyella sp.]|nr:glycosyltransferase family 2 protein [Winogradskyella sp.]